MDWIKVTDRFPENDTEVLVCIKKFGTRNPYYRIGWIDSETNKWYIYCELGQVNFEESSACNTDYYSITDWTEIKPTH